MALTSDEREKLLFFQYIQQASNRTLQEGNVMQLVNELNYYQAQLDNKDSARFKTKFDLDNSPLHHTDLYDFVPVGYFTLNASGLIVEVNLSGAKLLGLERYNLINRHFIQFMPDASQITFDAHLKKLSRNNSIFPLK